jgi:hypothetical protein
MPTAIPQTQSPQIVFIYSAFMQKIKYHHPSASRPTPVPFCSVKKIITTPFE